MIGKHSFLNRSGHIMQFPAISFGKLIFPQVHLTEPEAPPTLKEYY